MIGRPVSVSGFFEYCGSGFAGIISNANNLKLNYPVILESLSPDISRNAVAEAKLRLSHEAHAASSLHVQQTSG